MNHGLASICCVLMKCVLNLCRFLAELIQRELLIHSLYMYMLRCDLLIQNLFIYPILLGNSLITRRTLIWVDTILFINSLTA